MPPFLPKRTYSAPPHGSTNVNRPAGGRSYLHMTLAIPKPTQETVVEKSSPLASESTEPPSSAEDPIAPPTTDDTNATETELSTDAKVEEENVEGASGAKAEAEAETENDGVTTPTTSEATINVETPATATVNPNTTVSESPTSTTASTAVEIPSAASSQNAPAHNKGMPAACLFVASLSSARTDEQLCESVTKHFQAYGPLLNVKVLKDWLSRPYAFVQFEKVEDAKRALVEAHNTIVDGRHIRVEQARVNRTLFIAKFNRSMTEPQLKETLEKYGQVEDLTILQNYQTGRSKGCGFVKFCYREDAIRAYLGLRNTLKWVVEWAANLDKGQVELDKQSVFVGQLNQNLVTRELLEEKFGAYGKIENLQLVNRFSSGPASRPAFAFIKYSEEASAEKAIQAENGQTWLDRTIRVQYRETGEFRTPPHHPPHHGFHPHARIPSGGMLNPAPPIPMLNVAGGGPVPLPVTWANPGGSVGVPPAMMLGTLSPAAASANVASGGTTPGGPVSPGATPPYPIPWMGGMVNVPPPHYPQQMMTPPMIRTPSQASTVNEPNTPISPMPNVQHQQQTFVTPGSVVGGDAGYAAGSSAGALPSPPVSPAKGSAPSAMDFYSRAVNAGTDSEGYLYPYIPYTPSTHPVQSAIPTSAVGIPLASAALPVSPQQFGNFYAHQQFPTGNSTTDTTPPHFRQQSQPSSKGTGGTQPRDSTASETSQSPVMSPTIPYAAPYFAGFGYYAYPFAQLTGAEKAVPGQQHQPPIPASPVGQQGRFPSLQGRWGLQQPQHHPPAGNAAAATGQTQHSGYYGNRPPYYPAMHASGAGGAGAYPIPVSAAAAAAVIAAQAQAAHMQVLMMQHHHQSPAHPYAHHGPPPSWQQQHYGMQQQQMAAGYHSHYHAGQQYGRTPNVSHRQGGDEIEGQEGGAQLEREAEGQGGEGYIEEDLGIGMEGGVGGARLGGDDGDESDENEA
ncbi:hypothetical protein HK102_004000 [Quaeritorhiza haematococci]|nr:hypothetical protein HK102_004000 [Quaeritorhiza haematococci]